MNDSRKTKRRDHYIPQGYLRGFIDSSRANHPRPLWCFDIPKNRWLAKSPKEVGHRKGFYDYVHAGALLENESADSSFLRLENDYPRVKLKSMTPTPVPPAFIKNRAITQMREEIQKGAAWLRDFCWALRYCESVTDPFVISELPFSIEGVTPELEDAIRHPDTLLIFPLCWQACLFGSLRRFDIETDKLGVEDMRTSRTKYRAWAKSFILSPVQFDEFHKEQP